MSAKKTVFPTAVGYQREKFDPSLRLQRLPDTSQQAGQPFREEAAAIKTQAVIEDNFASLRDAVDMEVMKGQEKDLSFLQQLAPFSNLIQQEIENYGKRWDERRKRTADELAGKMALAARNSPEFQQNTRITNDMISRAWKSGRGDIVHDLSKLDWAMQAQVADSFVKQSAKGYSSSLAQHISSNQLVITNDAEAQSAIAGHDEQVHKMLENAGASPDVWEAWRGGTQESRTKELTKLINNNRTLQGEEIRQTSVQGLHGGARLVDVERRIMLSPLNKDRAYGVAKAHSFLLEHVKDGIKAGVYNYRDIEAWKQEIHPQTNKPIGEDKRYKYLFGQMDMFLNERALKDAKLSEAAKEKQIEEELRVFFSEVYSGETRISETQVQDLKNRFYANGLSGPKVEKFFKRLEDGLTVDDKAQETVEEELEMRLSRGEYIPQIDLMQYGQDLFNKYQGRNEINKKNQSHQAYKQLKEEGSGWIQQSSTGQPGAGGDLKITTVDAVKTQGQLRIINEWNKILDNAYKEVMTSATPEDDVYRSGTVGGQSVKDLALAKAIQEFERRKTNKSDVLYFDKQRGAYTNTLSVKTSRGYIGSDQAMKEHEKTTNRVVALQKLAASDNISYSDVLSQEPLLSQVITKEEAVKMKQQIEQGRGIPAAIIGLASVMGSQQLPTAGRIFNTYGLGSINVPTVNERLNSKLADPDFMTNFQVEDLMKRLNNPNAGPRQMQRIKNEILQDAARSEGLDDAPGITRTSYVVSQNISAEARALLRTLQWAEGTDKRGARAYGTHYGYEYTEPNGPHPDRVITKGGISSAAYGAYQFMPKTWADTSFGRQGLPMTPENQDMAALELVKNRFVNPDVELTTTDWDKLAPEWASIPHSRTGRGVYAGQNGKTLKGLREFYEKALREERYQQSIRGVI